MKNGVRVMILSVVAIAVIQSSISAQTLWEKRDPAKAFLFHDLKASRVGDLLTIVINENTDVANADSRALKKQTDTDAGTSLSYSGSASGSFDASIDANSSRNFNGDVTYSSARAFSDRFSVVVVDVLPNGNMLVVGKRTLLVEGDKKELTLTGIVRTHDIRGDNSVLSQQVAEMKIHLEGTGAESTVVNQGWLGKRLNRLWPF